MKRRVRLLLVVVALSSFGCIPKRVNWREVNAPADQSTLLHLPAGDVIGFTEQDGTLAWLGMPYAQAPVGPLRWKAPRPAARFDLLGFSATRYGPDCPQRSTDGTLSGDEACLTLNVASRSLTEQRRPVVVWLHDGDEGTGTANTWGFIRRMALRHNVVLVGVNYRLGALGWWRHPALVDATDSPADASGNYGLLDIIEALRWVRTNIGPFGGDPDNVTVVGGSQVFALLASPLATGLYQRAAIQSGLPASLTSDDAAARANDEDGLPDDTQPVELANALRNRTSEQLTALKGPFLPVRDGHVLPDSPLLDALSRGARPPVLLGGAYENDVSALLRRALGVDLAIDALLAGGTTVFAWRLDLPRALEAPLILGDEQGELAPEAADHVALSRTMMSYWAHFATTGDPARGMNEDQPTWEQATAAHRFMVFGDATRAEQGAVTMDDVLRFATDDARCAQLAALKTQATAVGAWDDTKFNERCAKGP